MHLERIMMNFHFNGTQPNFILFAFLEFSFDQKFAKFSFPKIYKPIIIDLMFNAHMEQWKHQTVNDEIVLSSKFPIRLLLLIWIYEILNIAVTNHKHNGRPGIVLFDFMFFYLISFLHMMCVACCWYLHLMCALSQYFAIFGFWLFNNEIYSIETY